MLLFNLRSFRTILVGAIIIFGAYALADSELPSLEQMGKMVLDCHSSQEAGCYESLELFSELADRHLESDNLVYEMTHAKSWVEFVGAATTMADYSNRNQGYNAIPIVQTHLKMAFEQVLGLNEYQLGPPDDSIKSALVFLLPDLLLMTAVNGHDTAETFFYLQKMAAQHGHAAWGLLESIKYRIETRFIYALKMQKDEISDLGFLGLGAEAYYNKIISDLESSEGNGERKILDALLRVRQWGFSLPLIVYIANHHRKYRKPWLNESKRRHTVDVLAAMTELIDFKVSHVDNHSLPERVESQMQSFGIWAFRTLDFLGFLDDGDSGGGGRRARLEEKGKTCLELLGQTRPLSEGA